MGVAADLDAARLHQRVGPLVGVELAGGMRVVIDSLADAGGADKVNVVHRVLALLKVRVALARVSRHLNVGILRAGVQAAAAAHALAEWILQLLLGW